MSFPAKNYFQEFNLQRLYPKESKTLISWGRRPGRNTLLEPLLAELREMYYGDTQENYRAYVMGDF